MLLLELNQLRKIDLIILRAHRGALAVGSDVGEGVDDVRQLIGRDFRHLVVAGVDGVGGIIPDDPIDFRGWI